jgi:hypothetical protein
MDLPLFSALFAGFSLMLYVLLEGLTWASERYCCCRSRKNPGTT